MLRILLLISAGAIFGCGASTYEARLSETKGYYGFLQDYNAHLEKPFRDSNTGIEIRVPKKMKPLPAPAAPSEGDPNPKDPRQPDYLELQFPGIVGAWALPTSATVNGEATAATAYFYVLSNIDLLRQQKPPFPAAEFYDEVIERVTKAIKIPLPAQNAWATEAYPRNATYMKPKDFHKIILTPAEPINGVPMEFYIFEYRQDQNPTKVSVIAVLPVGINPKDGVHEALPFSLGTLNVPATPPAPAASAPSGSPGTPAKKGGGGF
jgi:hypothetical protein